MDTDWNERYRTEDTPWDKGKPAPGLVDWLAKRQMSPNNRVLVPGCGKGHDAAAWADAQGCDGVEVAFETSFDGVDDLWCKSACSNIDHVLCSWTGGHNYFTGPGMNYIYECTPENADETYYQNGQLVWEFFSKHSK